MTCPLRELTSSSGDMVIMRHLEVGPLMVNCYIVGDKASGQGVIIDPGEHHRDILDVVRETELEIQYIIATHGHFDHNGAVAGLKRELGQNVPYLLHPGDQFFIPDSRSSAQRWGFDIEQVPEPDRSLHDGEYINLGDVSSVSVEEIKGTLLAGSSASEDRDRYREKVTNRPDKPERIDNVDNGGNRKTIGKEFNEILRLKVIHTPGHSPGGVCIYIESEGLLFSGDTLFQHSVGRTDFRKSSFDDLVASIRGKLYQLPDDTVVYPGHGPSTTIGAEKKQNMVVPERDRAAWFNR